MDWNDLRYFLGVARTGGLTRTAADLRVSQSTVSRRIAALEDDLGTRLFARHQTGYSLTDEGREIARLARAVEDDVLTLERTATGLDEVVTGVVRLATAENLATRLIIPALPALAERHPGLRLEIVTGVDQVGLSRREADLALRPARPDLGNLKRRKVGTMAYAVYGSVAYLNRHPAALEQPFAGREFVTWDDAHAHLPAARWVEAHAPGTQSALTTSSLAAQASAVRAGVGLGILPCFLIDEDDLVIEVLAPSRVFTEDLWLITHADLSGSARIQAVGDFLCTTINKAEKGLTGSAASSPA